MSESAARAIYVWNIACHVANRGEIDVEALKADYDKMSEEGKNTFRRLVPIFAELVYELPMPNYNQPASNILQILKRLDK